MTKPSMYNRADLEKGEVVEDRDQVKVSFAGGNSWHIQVEGVDEHESVRGSTKAWERAEKLRKELNSDYAGPPPEADETSGASEGGDTPAEPEAEAKPAAAKPAKSKKGKGAEPDGDKNVMIGHVKGVQRMVSVSVVEELLADQASRVALLRGSDETRRLQRRVRATDGRCAPIFLTRVNIEDAEEEPKLFDGLYTLAAAINLDMEEVAVVMLPSGSVNEVQGQIAAMMRSNLSQPEVEEGEELFYKAGRD